MTRPGTHALVFHLGRRIGDRTSAHLRARVRRPAPVRQQFDRSRTAPRVHHRGKPANGSGDRKATLHARRRDKHPSPSVSEKPGPARCRPGHYEVPRAPPSHAAVDTPPGNAPWACQPPSSRQPPQRSCVQIRSQQVSAFRPHRNQPGPVALSPSPRGPLVGRPPRPVAPPDGVGSRKTPPRLNNRDAPSQAATLPVRRSAGSAATTNLREALRSRFQSEVLDTSLQPAWPSHLDRISNMGLGDGDGQLTHAQNVRGTLRHSDTPASVKNIERMGTLKTCVKCRQSQV